MLHNGEAKLYIVGGNVGAYSEISLIQYSFKIRKSHSLAQTKVLDLAGLPTAWVDRAQMRRRRRFPELVTHGNKIYAFGSNWGVCSSTNSTHSAFTKQILFSKMELLKMKTRLKFTIPHLMCGRSCQKLQQAEGSHVQSRSSIFYLLHVD